MDIFYLDFTKMFDKTKKGNKDGKIFSLKIFKENSTDLKILSESTKIEIATKIKTAIIKILVNFFIFFSP